MYVVNLKKKKKNTIETWAMFAFLMKSIDGIENLNSPVPEALVKPSSWLCKELQDTLVSFTRWEYTEMHIPCKVSLIPLWNTLLNPHYIVDPIF